jgi:hypothetical protein
LMKELFVPSPVGKAFLPSVNYIQGLQWQQFS